MEPRFPFPVFPNGWFRVAYSDELPKKKVIPLHYFGKNLVLFRTEDGIARMWDAYCPHLGTHLGYGGKVEGNLIRCPFHGWAFNSQGSCTEIPYAGKIPEKAQIRAWPVSEKNGLIWVYHHALREAPSWEIPELPYWNPQEWSAFSRSAWKIRSHPQEMGANLLDPAHSLFLHQDIFVDCQERGSDFSRQVSSCDLFAKYRFPLFGKVGIESAGELSCVFLGLGGQLSYSRLKIITELDGIALFLLTPIDGEYLDVQVLVSVKKFFIPLITKAIQMKLNAQVIANLKQEIPIMENKVYFSHPVLCDWDNGIIQYRQWVRQFYSEDLEANGFSKESRLESEKLTR
ncbi:cholesterol 7-desaturase [Nostoc sp. DSM 114161]|jgi:phenylpropionate dioxygenase-like ring-hydroxylating dioxygenase large terminal subunit|uniref:Rieske 2Fe-2S domain-containing protein n=1 Tax=Nostoc sp. DSM 114161 TaxID=3440143 RepID=UPI0040463BA0